MSRSTKYLNELSDRELLMILVDRVNEIKIKTDMLHSLEMRIQALELLTNNNDKYFGAFANFILSVSSAVIIGWLLNKVK